MYCQTPLNAGFIPSFHYLGKQLARLLSVFILLIASVVCAEYVVADDDLYVVPGIDELNRRIDQLDSDGQLSESQKSAAIQTLKQAITQLETAAELKSQALRYKNSLTKAPVEQAELNSLLANYSSEPLPEDLSDAPLVKLDSLLTKEQLLLDEKRKRKADIDSELSQEKLLNVQALLEQTREQLQTAIQERDQLAGNTAVDSISTIAAISSVNALSARVQMLEQRLLSRTVRLQLLETEQQLLNRQLADAESRFLLLQNLMSGHRLSDAERLLASARRSQSSVGSKSKLLQAIAEQNVQFAKELKTLVSSQDTVLNLVEGFAYDAKRFEQKYTSLTEQLKITQLESSPAFGAALRKQRDNIADLDSTRQALKQYEAALTKSRLAQFQIDIEREPEAQLALTQSLESEEQASNPETVNKLLKQRETLLYKLSSGYTEYIGDLSKLIAQLRLLTANSRQYTELLDQQLVWMPSTDRVGFLLLGQSAGALIALVEQTDLGTSIRQVAIQAKRHSFMLVMVFVALAALLRQRKRLIQLLPSMKERVGKVHRDSFALTLTALLITLLLALPGPLSLLTLAKLFSVDDVTPGALSRALSYTALVYFVLAFVSQSLRPEGLAERHFKWDMLARHRLKKNLSWLKWIFLPLLAINLMAEFQDDALLRDSVGRLAFMMAALSAALFCYRAFNPGHSNYSNTAAASALPAPWQFRYFIYPLLFWPPVVLALLAAAGYYYSSMQLAGYWLQSLIIVLGAFYVFCLVRRALSISERRLALDRARAKRAAALTEQTADATAEAAPVPIDLEKIDLHTVSTQTDALLKMITAVALGIVLWNVWSEFISAFQRVDQIALWHISELINGSTVTSAITLWDIVLTIAVVVITFLAARNIPGLLEIMLLSRMTLETGTNYAVTTICRYIIVITGSVIALQLLGAQWSKLQWLVAALSVGLGFGLQEIVANFVSGVVILFERPIRIGDTVTIGDQFGTVSRIRIRATTIVDWDRREVIIPNKTFITERLVNWTLTDPIMRTIINVGVAYGSDVALVEKCLFDIASNNPRVLNDPPVVVLFRNFGDSSLDFQLRVFIKGIQELNPVVHELHIAIDREFKKLGINIAFPQRDLHLNTKPIEVRLINHDNSQQDGPLVHDFENDQPKIDKEGD